MMDLNLSQSLGGLRIANPDDSSPGSAPSSRGDGTGEPLANLSQVISNSSVDSQLSPAPIGIERSSTRPSTTLDFDVNNFSTESITIEKPPLQLLPLNNPREELPPLQQVPPQRATSQRKQPRHILPPTFQSQQQQQFPSYPVPKMQQPFNTASRPISMMQGQPPPGPGPGPGSLPQRDMSYRLHKESSSGSLHNPPRRSSSRSAHQALQAGVPMRETGNPDRSYRVQTVCSRIRAMAHYHLERAREA